MNNPNRNSYGAPRLVYRIDSRPPEVVFRDGFVAWGSNTDFFRHILGVIQNPALPYHLRSIYISTTDSPDSAIRFFAARFSSRHHFNQPDNPHIMYLYEIRADESFYSAIVTGNRCLEVINQNRYRLSPESTTLAWAGLRSLFYDFAYQREWIHVGNIHTRNIRSVHRLQAIPVDPRYARFNRRTYNYPTYATVRIEAEEYINPNYVDGFTYANHLPLEVNVNINDNGRGDFTTHANTTVDSGYHLGPYPTPPSSGVAGGIASMAFSNTTTAIVGTEPCGPDVSMGFACPTASLSSVITSLPSSARSKRNIDDNVEIEDDVLDQKEELKISPLVQNYEYSFLSTEEIKEKIKLIYIDHHEELIKQKVIFTIGDNNFYALKIKKENNLYNACGTEYNDETANVIFYDSHLRLTTELENIHYPVSLTVNYSRELSEKTYAVSFETSSINNDGQKWIFNLNEYQKNNDQLWYTVDSSENSNMCLYIDIHTKQLVLREKFNNNERFKTIYVVVSKDKTEHTLLKLQRPLNNLVDLGLEWINPLNGKTYKLDTSINKFVISNRNIKYKFFYDIETFEILDLEDKSKSYALCNNMLNNEYHTIKWIEIYPGQKRLYDRYKWYIKSLYNDQYKDASRKQIISFVDNKILRISIENSDNFGSLYLSNNYNVRRNDTVFVFRKRNIF